MPRTALTEPHCGLLLLGDAGFEALHRGRRQRLAAVIDERIGALPFSAARFLIFSSRLVADGCVETTMSQGSSRATADAAAERVHDARLEPVNLNPGADTARDAVRVDHVQALALPSHDCHVHVVLPGV